MKNYLLIFRLFLLVLMLSMLFYCSKDSTKEVTPPAVKVSLPIVTTSAAATVTATGATLGGNVTSDGNATVIERGVVYATTQNPTTSNTKLVIGTGTGSFTINATGLSAGTTYYVRAYATNNQGTAYGSQETFSTTLTLSLATITTTAASTITSTGATLGGNVTSDGNATVSECGVVYATTQTPTTANSKVSIGTGTGVFTNAIAGLTSGTVYYARAYAINSQGTAYGNQVTFTTTSGGGTVTDIDGNVYKTITIGTQVWMAENLKTTKYKDGTSIPLVTSNSAWESLTTPGYCWYNNDASTYKSSYGALYNWYTVNTGKLCPTDWHVPTEADWNSLTSYLGGYAAGGKLKEMGTAHWISPNTGATNSSGFTAMPGGFRGHFNAEFVSIGSYGRWWISTAYDASNAWNRMLGFNDTTIYIFDYDKQGGFSVRCVKD
jgi:uncharacterized protein (TIGR02145 family)